MDYKKLSGSGNTFVIVNNLSQQKINPKELAIELCLKEKTDGLLLIEPSKICDFKMRIFNKDGSEAEMCGNGSRCAAFFGWKENLAENKMEIETLWGRIKAIASGDLVKVMIGEPKDIRLNIMPNCHFVRVGVPHTIVLVDDVDNLDVFSLGRKIRFDKVFEPEGTNVDFVEVEKENKIKIRTYERGVEDETLSCGTGSCASCYILYLLNKTHFPTIVEARSKELLNVYFEDNRLYLEGRVKEI
ncbi:MAG: diaminopimelate epimerase [bacterium]